MRTTVTLDKDVEKMLRDAMHRSRKSFKETLNTAVRNGLGGRPGSAKRKRFIVEAHPLGLRSGIDPTSFNKLVDELEADTFLVRNRIALGDDRPEGRRRSSTDSSQT
jgi:hypothetical protein